MFTNHIKVKGEQLDQPGHGYGMSETVDSDGDDSLKSPEVSLTPFVPCLIPVWNDLHVSRKIPT